MIIENLETSSFLRYRITNINLNLCYLNIKIIMSIAKLINI